MFSTESNINEVIKNLQRKARALAKDITGVVTNNVEYAAAVEFGYSRTYRWAELPAAQRAAIILSMQDPKYRRKNPDVDVERFEGGWTISYAGAGMMAKSVPIVRKHGNMTKNQIGPGATMRQFEAWMNNTLSFAHATLVQHTPVDNGVLVGGWEPRII